MSFPVVLFDIDGTLTEPRRVITKDVIEILNELAKLVEIGFVTGSDLEYVKEQMSALKGRLLEIIATYFRVMEHNTSSRRDTWNF